MDNLSVHVSGDSKDEMKRLGLRYAYNVSYEPKYNPIEMVFNIIKKNFKTLRARKHMALLHLCHRDLIRQSVHDVKKVDI